MLPSQELIGAAGAGTPEPAPEPALHSSEIKYLVLPHARVLCDLVPLDAEEFVAAQLLLDGAAQKEGSAVAGGVSIVGEQDHQQEHHVNEEVLQTEEKGITPEHRVSVLSPTADQGFPPPAMQDQDPNLAVLSFPYRKQFKMKPRPQAHNNICCSKQPGRHQMFKLIRIAQPPRTSSYTLAACI